ncbi:hypothetical protein KAR91_78165 [Candidatus Pacearchaeota archaeon]|nr:hypothetical protein [Candidatus Pacearchaeota archaeon]
MADLTLTQVFLIWVLGFGIISMISKEKIVNIFKKSKLPTILNYYIILTPLVLIEEALTCETPFFSCIKVTLIAFYLFFLILYFIQKTFKLGYIKTSIIFGLIGWVNEFIIVGRINVLTPPQIILFTVLGILIYSVLAILPSYYLEQTFKKK